MLVNGLKSGVVPSALNVRIRVDIALLTLIYQWKQTATSFITTHKIAFMEVQSSNPNYLGFTCKSHTGGRDFKETNLEVAQVLFDP